MWSMWKRTIRMDSSNHQPNNLLLDGMSVAENELWKGKFQVEIGLWNAFLCINFLTLVACFHWSDRFGSMWGASGPKTGSKIGRHWRMLVGLGGWVWVRGAEGGIWQDLGCRSSSIGSRPCFTHLITLQIPLLTAKLTAKGLEHPKSPDYKL